MVRNDNIFFSLQNVFQISGDRPMLAQTDLLTVSTSGKATPSENSDSLTLGFRKRNSYYETTHTPPQVPYWEHVRQQVDQYQWNTADYHQHS